MSEESIGQKVKKYRSEQKMSQGQLATGICTVSAISQIESDRIRPTTELVEKLAKRLEIPISCLIDVADFAADVDYLLSYAKVLIQKQQYEEAMRVTEDLQDVSRNQSYTIRLLRAECQMRLGERLVAIDQLQNLLGEIQHQSTLNSFTLQAHRILGAVFYFQQDITKSYYHYQVAYQLSLQDDKVDPSIVADLMHNLGLVCNNLGKYKEASSYLFMAHKFYEKTSDIRSLADTYYELGISTRESSYMNKAWELYESLGVVRLSNMVRQYYAFHVMATENYLEAIEELLDCSERFYHLGDKCDSLFPLARAVEVSVVNRDLESASRVLKVAEQRFDELKSGFHGYVAYYYQVRGRYFLFLKNYEMCAESALLSAEMFDKMGMKEDASDSYHLLSDSLSVQGLYKEALEYQVMATKLLRKERN